jgi:Rhodopirellula transposase DDE domain
MIDEDQIRQRFEALAPHLDERGRRQFAAVEARLAGYGGIAAVARATGIAPSTIWRGLAELDDPAPLSADRVRRPGGGRRRLVEKDANLLADLEGLVAPGARGDPMSPLRWTGKSLRRLAAELRAMGHAIGHMAVRDLLKGMPFSLQANRKTREGDHHPDRDAQFASLNNAVSAALAEEQPAISVDTKKKELVGDFKNPGREWRPRGDPEAVRVHDFLIKELGRAIPDGVYDLAANDGWVRVGIDHDTACFAVHSIRRWWQAIGRPRYPTARRLVITADGGGSNGARLRLWKSELQKLATELAVDIEVHHLPPGTSKWNQIEHRLFSFISMNWRARPLISYRVIVDLISATRTQTGLSVRCELDEARYPLGIVVSKAEFAAINISRDAFHGDWNYTIHPQHSDNAVNF